MIALFVLRETGLKKEIIDDFFNILKSEGNFTVLEQKLVTLNNKDVFYKNFYNEIKSEDIQKEIRNISGRNLLVVVCNNSKPESNDPMFRTIDKCVMTIKQFIRAKYGNVIHTSDDENMANTEVELLLRGNKQSNIDYIELNNTI